MKTEVSIVLIVIAFVLYVVIKDVTTWWNCNGVVVEPAFGITVQCVEESK